MNVMQIRTLDDLEEFIGTWFKILPTPSKKIRKNLSNLLPYLVSMVAFLLIFMSLLNIFNITVIPNFLPSSEKITQDILLLLNGTYIFLGFILINAFKPLALWEKRGWKSVFYVSLIYFLMHLVFFNYVQTIAILAFWYILFTVREEYA